MDSTASKSESCTRIDEADDGPNSDQVQGCKRTLHVSSDLLSACGRDHAMAPSRFRGHRWINPTTQEECCPHMDESLASMPSGRPWRRAGSPSGPQPHLSTSLWHVWVQPRASASTGHPRTTTAGIESSQVWRPFALIGIAIGRARRNIL